MNAYNEHMQRMWKIDINSYYRWKAIYDEYGSEIAKKRMEEIKASWPNHAKAFE